MATIDLDTTAAGEEQELIPRGKHPVIVDSVELRDNQAGDGQYLNWKLILTEGEFEGRSVYLMTSLKESALFRLADAFQAVGVPPGPLHLNVDDDTNLLLEPDVVGLSAIAHVSINLYQGRKSNRCDRLSPMTLNDELVKAPTVAPAAVAPATAPRTAAAAGPVAKKPTLK